jgi:hypothetical protein
MHDAIEREAKDLEEEIEIELLCESIRASDRLEMARTRRVDLITMPRFDRDLA